MKNKNIGTVLEANSPGGIVITDKEDPVEINTPTDTPVQSTKGPSTTTKVVIGSALALLILWGLSD